MGAQLDSISVRNPVHWRSLRFTLHCSTVVSLLCTSWYSFPGNKPESRCLPWESTPDRSSRMRFRGNGRTVKATSLSSKRSGCIGSLQIFRTFKTVTRWPVWCMMACRKWTTVASQNCRFANKSHPAYLGPGRLRSRLYRTSTQCWQVTSGELTWKSLENCRVIRLPLAACSQYTTTTILFTYWVLTNSAN